MLKLGTPGGLELFDQTVFPFGQFQDKCLGSLQLKHLPTASNLAFSFSLKFGLGLSNGLGVNRGFEPPCEGAQLPNC